MKFIGKGGFGVPVADVLSAPSTPAYLRFCSRAPGASCAALVVKAYALALLQERFVSNPQFPVFIKFLINTELFAPYYITEQGGFEPPEPLRVQWFSKPSPSTARTPLQ